MQVITKDILTVEKGIIVHQTNCQGVMGAGIALLIKNKWPEVYNQYKLCVRDNYYKGSLLGKVQFVKVSKSLHVVNLFGQDRYGRDKRYTSYGAWEKALPELKEMIAAKALCLEDLYFPFGCGCNNAGGNWEIISRMIEEYFPNAIICTLYKQEEFNEFYPEPFDF